jgi:formamidase
VIRIGAETRLPLAAQPGRGHNRWHPDIPPIATVACGELVAIETRDGIDGQIGPDGGVADVAALDMSRPHPMTGPIHVEGAEPGDLLEVETVSIEPDAFGFTVVRPGGGLLGAEIERPLVVRWEIADGVARSADLPGVAIPGAPFMGLMGVAPSSERLREFAARECELERRGGAVRLPDAVGAVPAVGEAAEHGLRTVPPRETGGNLDIKRLTAGSKLLLPVDVPGALFSVGDAHFAQGDGESCSQAIEMRASVVLRFGLRKAATLAWRPTYPVAEYSEQPAAGPRRYLATSGIPVEADGTNRDLDLLVAARAALREMLAYLTAVRGLSREQAYALCSVAVDLQISEVVNVPNAVVAAVLPLDIFIEQ